MIKNIPKIITFTTLKASFSTKPLTPGFRKQGKYFIPQLPAYTLNKQVLRSYTKDQQQVPLEQYNQMFGTYNKYREIPQCRYFAVQYRNRIYHVFNAYYYPMGRMINLIATYIRGKNSPHFKNSYVDIKNGDICVIVNAVDPLFTGRKLMYKQLRYHTGFIGHLKTFSYRQILNRKPQLLYYYLLRKVMPKNKVSQHYLKNLKIYRGPTHDIPNIPQFSPMKFLQSPLTNIDSQQFQQYSKKHGKVIYENPIHANPNKNNAQKKQKEEKQPNRTLQTDDQYFGQQTRMKMVYKYTTKQIKAFLTLQKKLLKRHRIVRAPYNRQPKFDPGFKIFYSQKQAKKMPYYKEMLDDQNRPEDDDQIVEDPLRRKGFDK